MSIPLNPLVGFLRKLIRVRSPSGQEEEVVALITREMRALGFDEVRIDENGSAIGLIYGARPGPTLLLDAHCDTVGIAPGVAWQHPPFEAEVVGDVVYGRGASDMKGALAAMIYAAAHVDRSRLAGRVAVSATVMEEVMEGVSLASVMEEIQPDYVVIGEATDLGLNIGGRGRSEIRLEAPGKPAHSSNPHLGDNAVLKMIPAIQAIEQLVFPEDPLLGPGLMVLTDIISEPYPGKSVIPSLCRVTYDRRLLPGEHEVGVLEALRAIPELSGIKVSIVRGRYETYTGAVLDALKFFPAWKLEPTHPLVQKALKGLRAAGLDPTLGAYRFCTNAAYSAGRAGVPTIGFGPGTEARAHVVDEYITLTELQTASRGYLYMIHEICR